MSSSAPFYQKPSAYVPLLMWETNLHAHTKQQAKWSLEMWRRVVLVVNTVLLKVNKLCQPWDKCAGQRVLTLWVNVTLLQGTWFHFTLSFWRHPSYSVCTCSSAMDLTHSKRVLKCVRVNWMTCLWKPVYCSDRPSLISPQVAVPN
jgi:hypothetical protein